LTWQWDDGRGFDLDEHGWVRSLQPNQIARAIIITLPANSYPSGAYTILYDGEGDLAYIGSARKNTALSKPGRDIIEIDASTVNGSSGTGGLRIEITRTNPNNYIRNIRVLLPGGSCSNDASRWCAIDSDCERSTCEPFESTYNQRRFHPVFLQSLRHFQLIRFMDWGATNNSSVRSWDQRVKLTDAIWGRRGVPFEVMLELANALRAHPWINIPHEAEDNFITSLATMIKSQLSPELVAHVEYSNEVWNSGFSQYRYAALRGKELGLATSDWEAGWRFYAIRSKQVFQIFEGVFGGTSRLRRILASQAASAYVSDIVLRTDSAYQHADALAIAPYFGHEYGSGRDSPALSWNTTQLLDDIERNSLPKSIEWMSAQKSVADKFGVRLVAYEGGQHLAGFNGGQDNTHLTALFMEANGNSRMKGFYERYLNAWASTSSDVFVHFNHVENWSKWGSWGSAQRYPALDRSIHPKYEAVREATLRHPR